MSSPRGGAILPISLTLNDRTGITLWAPPWEDENGDEWQGFLGDGAKILLFPTAAELAGFVASGADNDLADHPGWPRIQNTPPGGLRPAAEHEYDMDEVYELASSEPDPLTVSKLADLVDLVARIADCCEDGALRRLVGSTEAYADLVSDDVSYHGKDGRKRWSVLGDTVADTWERAVARVEQWLSWRGDFGGDTDLSEPGAVWETVSAAPIELVLPDASYFTLRAVHDDEVLFLGHDVTVYVFATVPGLAEFCREADEHDLQRLELWERVKGASPRDFEPAAGDTIDLREPSDDAAEIVGELADYCELDADLGVLETRPIDPAGWRALVTELAGCFQQQD